MISRREFLRAVMLTYLWHQVPKLPGQMFARKHQNSWPVCLPANLKSAKKPSEIYLPVVRD